MPGPKITIVFLFLSSLCIAAIAQNKTVDSLKKALVKEKADSMKANITWLIADAYSQNRPDSELVFAQQALSLSKKINYLTGEMKATKSMGEAYQLLGNYPLALQYYLQRLKLDEQAKDPETEVVTLLSVANLYQYEGDFKQALFYAKKGYALIEKRRLEDYRWYSYMVFGDLYERMNDLPNAISYNKKAYDLAKKNKNDDWLGQCYNNSANVFVKVKQYPQALAYYQQGVPLLKANNEASFLCESYQGIAGLYLLSGKLDSAVIYAKQSIKLAVNSSFSQKYVRSCQILTDIYKAQRLPDSALVYQGKMLVMKDSIYSQEKANQVASLTISEELRQKERIQEKAEEDAERAYKLKLLLVGLLIPFSFLVSLILSKRKMHHRIVEFSGVISLLLLFEYLTILLHPIVLKWTGHSPFLEIVIFVCIAAVLTPSHHRLEHWMLHKLTHKHYIPPAAGEKAQPVNAIADSTPAPVAEEETPAENKETI